MSGMFKRKVSLVQAPGEWTLCSSNSSERLIPWKLSNLIMVHEKKKNMFSMYVFEIVNIKINSINMVQQGIFFTNKMRKKFWNERDENSEGWQEGRLTRLQWRNNEYKSSPSSCES